MHTFEEVKKLLESKGYGFYDQAYHTKPGLRLIELDAEAFRLVVHAEAVGWMLNMLFHSLPADAYIMDADGALIRQLPVFDNVGNATYRETYGILIASEEWPALEGGAPIPRLKFEISARLVEVQ